MVFLIYKRVDTRIKSLELRSDCVVCLHPDHPKVVLILCTLNAY